MMGKVRPQIFIALLCGTAFGAFGMFIGWKMDATEIVTAVIGSVFGFLGGVSLKVLEAE
jgi:ABC-type multidrug transport system permease subunit